jgi:hypothetical protein
MRVRGTTPSKVHSRRGLEWLKRWLGVWLAYVVIAALSAPVASAKRVELRGSSRISVNFGRANGRLVLRGQLTDEAGSGLPGEHVLLQVLSDTPEGTGAIRAALAGATTCGGKATGLPAQDDGLSVRVEENGRFCLAMALPALPYRMQFRYAGGPFVTDSALTVPVDVSRTPLTIAFVPTPRVVSLDDHDWNIAVIATTNEEGALHGEAGLTLRLENETGTQLASATTDATGKALFRVETDRLGSPGRGEVRASFEGNESIGPARVSFVIERRAHVTLQVSDPITGGVPDDGIPFTVRARWRGGPVTGGAVVARVGKSDVGAAPVDAAGLAQLTATFAWDRTESVPVTLGYAAAYGPYDPGEPITIVVPVRTPGPLRHLPLVVAAGLLVLWIAWGRVERRTSAASKPRAPLQGSGGASVAEVELLRPHTEASWHGQVVDAHSGAVIPHAVIELRQTSFDRKSPTTEARADALGRFTLGAPDGAVTSQCTLHAYGVLHDRAELRAPAFGEVVIRLITRRRSLLERLLAAVPKPEPGKPEPTPSEIGRGAPEGVAAWAKRVEAAAYGVEPVDATRQAWAEGTHAGTREVTAPLPRPSSKAPDDGA